MSHDTHTHEATLSMLAEAVEQRRLRPLDIALARFLAERDPHASPALLLLTALLSRQLADGHLCLDLAALDALAAEYEWPSTWRVLLTTAPLSSPLLADAQGLPLDAPLVLDDTRIYLRRYWNHERDVADAIGRRLAFMPLPPDALSEELTRLFPAPMGDTPDWPRIACALAARGAFSVITGGPGTGKTTTVVRLLGLLQTLHLRDRPRPLRIRLAAPTGKAAARLNASIAAQIARLDVSDAVRAAIPAQVDTLHRLLGARVDSRSFRHNRANPLHLDVLVVDEASMIDLEMMAAVLAALPEQARLILLGDKDQLSSVEAGAVLGDLCRRAEEGHYNEATAAWLHAASGDDISAFIRSDAQALDQQVAMLRHSHRFGAASGIGRLAMAVNAGDIHRVHNLLDTPHEDIAWISSDETARLAAVAIDGGGTYFAPSASGNTPQGYRHYLTLLRRERPTVDAGETAHAEWAHRVLEGFDRFQLLCALRRGPFGAEGLNRQIADALQAAGLIESAHGWYEGRPVMITRNDYSLGLMNGDIGITLSMPGRDGIVRLYVAFPIGNNADASDDGRENAKVRFVLPSRLGDVDTVYAMTVHKSQGSEFEHTMLVLPGEASAALTRELLYTGITRARRWFSLLGPQNSVELAVTQRTRRHSGLAERWTDTTTP
ncbi:MAG: exodeoxyribonuclease V subunit alpha [Rhodanobacter sp.]